MKLPPYRFQPVPQLKEQNTAVRIQYYPRFRRFVRESAYVLDNLSFPRIAVPLELLHKSQNSRLCSAENEPICGIFRENNEVIYEKKKTEHMDENCSKSNYDLKFSFRT
jgi:hypothetical protein